MSKSCLPMILSPSVALVCHLTCCLQLSQKCCSREKQFGLAGMVQAPAQTLLAFADCIFCVLRKLEDQGCARQITVKHVKAHVSDKAEGLMPTHKDIKGLTSY